jgi:hypothetical protein
MQDIPCLGSNRQMEGGRISKRRLDILQEIEDKDRRRQAF